MSFFLDLSAQKAWRTPTNKNKICSRPLKLLVSQTIIYGKILTSPYKLSCEQWTVTKEYNIRCLCLNDAVVLPLEINISSSHCYVYVIVIVYAYHVILCRLNVCMARKPFYQRAVWLRWRGRGGGGGDGRWTPVWWKVGSEANPSCSTELKLRGHQLSRLPIPCSLVSRLKVRGDTFLLFRSSNWVWPKTQWQPWTDLDPYWPWWWRAFLIWHSPGIDLLLNHDDLHLPPQHAAGSGAGQQ